jgi:hypothetical protein
MPFLTNGLSHHDTPPLIRKAEGLVPDRDPRPALLFLSPDSAASTRFTLFRRAFDNVSTIALRKRISLFASRSILIQASLRTKGNCGGISQGRVPTCEGEWLASLSKCVHKNSQIQRRLI